MPFQGAGITVAAGTNWVGGDINPNTGAAVVAAFNTDSDLPSNFAIPFVHDEPLLPRLCSSIACLPHVQFSLEAAGLHG